MITEDKFIKLFCIINEFCQHFEAANASLTSVNSITIGTAKAKVLMEGLKSIS